MKSIKILGTGCAKCKNTFDAIESWAKENNISIQLEKIEALPQIMAYGVMSTPAVVINETVVHKGSVPSKTLIQQWLTGE